MRGLLLLLFGIGVISSVDNFVRAMIVGGRTELHPLAVFLSVLGGMGPVRRCRGVSRTGALCGAVSLLDMGRSTLDQEGRSGGLLTSGESNG